MSLPIGIRKRLGVGKGGSVLIEETEDGVVLRTVDQVVARAQALTREFTKGKPAASVEAFLADRRTESGE
jgi:bifunctional DNA-binding transcriptional regulator/antitoxin component of YhaV-PrlF toxin-antitoxin module